MVDKSIGGIVLAGIVLTVIGLLLLVILLPLSFSYLDFYEYGFTRRRSTSFVDTSKVYAGGRHFLGPDYEFREYDAAAHFVYFNHIPIHTKDNLQVSITVELQYFLIKEDLKLLHLTYGPKYQSIIVKNANDALKNSITKFDTDEFISNRSVIQEDLYYGVRQRLAGKCCVPLCKTKESCPQCKKWELCDPGCMPRKNCSMNDKGSFVEIRYLQLQDIDIPSIVNERKLLSLIKDLEKEKEEHIKNETIVRKDTELEVTKIKNVAKEILANATAQYDLILNQAEVNYSRIIENTHNLGLQNMFQKLDFSNPKLKSSMNYIRALKDHEKVKYLIDFNTLVATTN